MIISQIENGGYKHIAAKYHYLTISEVGDLEHSIITRKDSSEVFKYDFEGYPVLSQVGHMLAWKNHVVDVHWHNDIEFNVVRKGSLNFLINGETVRLEEGQGLVVNSRRLHGHSTDGQDCEYLCTLMHPMLLCASSELEQRYVAPMIDDGFLPYVKLDGSAEWHGRVIERLGRIHDHVGDAAAPMIIQSLFYEIWLEMYENLCAEKSVAAPVQRADRGLNATREMVVYVQEHFREKVTLEDIAKAGAVSKSTCLALFKKYLHDSPINYMILCRVSAAAERLESSGLSVTEIAYECGFSSASYFIETFGKVRGVSPLEYRKSLKNGAQEE